MSRPNKGEHMTPLKNDVRTDLYVEADKKDLSIYDKELEVLAKQMTAFKRMKNREALYAPSTVREIERSK